MSGGLALALRTLAAEGLRSVVERALDHLAYRRQAPRPTELGEETRGAPGRLRSDVLHLLATPPKPWFGGVQVHVARRRELESSHAPFALLFPERGRYCLEVWHGAERRAWWLGPAAADQPARLSEPAFERAVERAVRWLGARVLHVENLAGLPLGSVLARLERGLPAVISVHDFAAFCPRPHLIERPMLRFCHYSRDLERCARCLGANGTGGGGLQAARREMAARLLARAEAVVYPSDYLRDVFRDLFPGLEPRREVVRPPLTGLDPTPLPRSEIRSEGTIGDPIRLAFVGSVNPHKGSRVFAEVVDALTPAERGRFDFSAYGGGDAGELAALRRRGVAVRGYYRASRLPERLRRDRIDLALLPSIYPEPYGLTLDECLAAGVAVLAFDHGAVAERLRRWSGGWLVPPEEGAAGILRRLRDLPEPTHWPRPNDSATEPVPLDYGHLYPRAGIAAEAP